MTRMEAEQREQLRRLPGVDAVLEELVANPVPAPVALVTDLVRKEIDTARRRILEGKGVIPEVAWLARQVHRRFEDLIRPRPHYVINGTGVLVHTNLGRSPIAPRIAEHMRQVASTYGDLEYNLEHGGRGSRLDHIRELLQLLTGAEDALVVNNNAAAVLLALAGHAAGKEVIVSRGELVEIGGSFRIPEVLEQSARLREVGTTNRTHLKDYEQAINNQTGMLLKVHTSNYRVEGFTAEVELSDLVTLGKQHGVPVVVDLGSGALVDVSETGMRPEPLVADVVGTGADVVTFSGDKLLGGPQAGIAVGSRRGIEAMKKHPLARAVRADKTLLAGVQGTLATFLDPDRAKQEIPILRMMFEPLDQVEQRGEALCREVSVAFENMSPRPVLTVEPSVAAIGGGSLPGEGVASRTLVLDPQGAIKASAWERALRGGSTPVVALIKKESLALDVRTLGDEEMHLLPDLLVSAWNAALGERD